MTEIQPELAQWSAQLGSWEADLPTEAEWEYSCRAATVGPFSFGSGISPEVVNYDGENPYGDGPRGEYRKRTVPVCSLPPNRWGLFEMHGNVWEWCKDGLRKYALSEEADPRGSMGKSPRKARAVRGGSWFDYASNCRSAYRLAFSRSFRHDSLGFRLCLRSIPASTRPPGGRGE